MTKPARQSVADNPDDATATPPADNVDGWVLYDGDCGICRRLAKRFGSLITGCNLGIEPLQSPWVIEAYQLPEEELMRDIRLRFVNGDHLQGADVYRYVARRTWWLWPFWLLSIIPGIHYLTNRSYRAFADNRHRFSNTCNL